MLLRNKCKKVLINNLRCNSETRQCIQREQRVAERVYKQNLQALALRRLKKRVENVAHWREVYFKKNPTNEFIKNPKVYALFQKKVAAIQSEILTVSAIGSLSQWHYFAKMRKEKAIENYWKISKVTLLINSHHLQRLFFEWKTYIIKLKTAKKHISKTRKLKVFAMLKEFIKRSFTSKLIRRKILNFSAKTCKAKAFKALIISTHISNYKKANLIKSITHYQRIQKALVLLNLRLYHQNSYIKQIKHLKALKFWSKNLKYKIFSAFFENYQIRYKKKLNIRRAADLRVFDLQQDIIKKWIAAGMYWKEKNEKENIKSVQQKEERVWKTVQRVAEVWISKIRRKKANTVEKQEIHVPPVKNTQQEVYEIFVEFKKRPEPRRLNFAVAIPK